MEGVSDLERSDTFSYVSVVRASRQAAALPKTEF